MVAGMGGVGVMLLAVLWRRSCGGLGIRGRFCGGLDQVVDAFEGSGGSSVVVPGEDLV